MGSVKENYAAIDSIDHGSRRSDAVRNRTQILKAAVATFAAFGLKATIPEIAAAAGVGSASVYRNFPTKADLVTAVVASEGEEISRAIVALSTRKSDGDDLRTAVSSLFAVLARNRLLADALAGEGASAFSPVVDALLVLIEHGKQNGTVNAEIDSSDFILIMCGAVRQLRFTDESDSSRWERVANLVMTVMAP
jgi:AcrR family transcriptional regulator